MKRRASGFIFESEYAQRAFAELVGALGCPSRVIHNGLLESEFAPLERESPLYDFIFVGELRKLKGVHVFITEVDVVDTSVDYRKLCDAEYNKLKGPLNARMEAVLGAEARDYYVENWRAMTVVLHGSELITGCIRARKSGV